VRAQRPDCTFCRIVGGNAPAQIVYRGEGVTAFRDIHPQAPVHILIVPDRHIARLDDAQPEDAELLGRLLLAARQLAEQEGLSDGYRLVLNTGPRAGQSVFHLHLHLLGGRSLRWPPG
jgi:histidine triad (HIT) family protein